MTTQHTETVVQTFVELARIESPARAEHDVAEYICGFADSLGLEVRQDTAGAEIGGTTNNLLISVPPTTSGTPLFFCAHMDTVALADSIDPVVLGDGKITNSRDAILGGDNKAAVAVMLELMRDLTRADLQHAGVEFVFTPAEEIGLLGAKAFDTKTLQARMGYVFDHAEDIGKVVGKAPTQMSIRVTFTGEAAHSGIAPEAGRSAVVAAAHAIARMDLGRIDPDTTANIGIIEGGSAVNITPEQCVLRGEARSLDHERAATVAQSMVDVCNTVAAACNVDVTVDVHEEYRAYQFTESSPPVKLAMQALADCKYDPQLIPCGGGSDANVFNAMNVPCANLCNAMRKIHTSDEYIMVDDLNSMLDVSRRIVSMAAAD